MHTTIEQAFIARTGELLGSGQGERPAQDEIVLSARAWFRRHPRYRSPQPPQPPQPPRPAVLIMLGELELTMAARKLKPVALACVCWPSAASGDGSEPHEHLARIAVTCVPGEHRRPLVTWYAWQHPVWDYACEPMPTADGAATLPALTRPVQP